jgi:hypothetical protein
MTDAAVFQAVYTDWTLIKGRKVVRVGLEIPIEQADLAYQALGGMPNPAESAWVAVARLESGAASSIGKPREAPPAAPGETHTTSPPGRPYIKDKTEEWDFKPKSYAFEAVRYCREIGFQRWLMVEWPDAWRMMNSATDEQRAREIVIWQCRVKSRSELREGTEAGELWKELKLRYERPDLAA